MPGPEPSDLDAAGTQRIVQQVDRGAREIVQRHGPALRGTLPRHVQECPHDPSAAFGGIVDALRVVTQRHAMFAESRVLAAALQQ